MDATLGDLLFWGSLAFALAIAGVAAYPLVRAVMRSRETEGEHSRIEPHGSATRA